jgi:hypothetical protein
MTQEIISNLKGPEAATGVGEVVVESLETAGPVESFETAGPVGEAHESS